MYAQVLFTKFDNFYLLKLMISYSYF